MFFLSKKYTYFFIVIVLIFKNVIAIGLMLDKDCEIFEKALSNFNTVFTNNDDIINLFHVQNVTHCCDYEQIECEPINFENHITKINFNDLKFKEMTNEVLSELSNLSYLETLEVNRVDGISESISKLTSLKVLIYKSQKIGSIPEKIKFLSNLEILDFSDTLIDRDIPETICDLKNLNTLNLRNCHIPGKIPECFENMDKLEKLDLNNNKLSGSVPLIPNIKTCDYEQTDLCNLKKSKCKSNKNICSSDDEPNKPESNNGNNIFAKIVVFILIIISIITICGVISLFKIFIRRLEMYRENEQKQNQQNQQNQRQYNINVNANTASSSSSSNAQTSTTTSPNKSNKNNTNNNVNDPPTPDSVPLKTDFTPSAPFEDSESPDVPPPPYSEKDTMN